MTSAVPRPKVALISTGGTIGALAHDPLEILDYGEAGNFDAAGFVARCPQLERLARIVPVNFASVPSFDIHLPQWLGLLATCDGLAKEHADLAGIVVTHGTGSLEETAYVFSLLCPLEIPVVFVGAQRPPSAAGSDAWMNLAQAIGVASDAAARGLGPLVAMNGEIHAARDVRKTSNLGMDAFRSPDFGPIGLVAGLEPRILRRPLHKAGPTSDFAGRAITALPRVDILYCHAGGDAVAVRAFIDAGARGIVLAGFPPGFATSEQAETLSRWSCEQDGIVVHASRADGPTVATRRNADAGFLPSQGLPPVKARLLLSVALGCGLDRDAVRGAFRSH